MQRLWAMGSMEWVMAPDDIKAGDRITWAGNTYVVLLHKNILRVRRVTK